MKNILLACSVIVATVITAPVFSQTDEDIEKMKQDFENYKKQEKENFREFVEKRDREFAEYIQNEMDNFEFFAGRKKAKNPGPDRIPRFKPKQKLPQAEIKPDFEQREIKELPGLPKIQITTEKPQLVLPDKIEQKPNSEVETAKFNFYGHNINFTYDPELVIGISEITGSGIIGDYFEQVSKKDYYPLIEQLITQHNKLNINDWAYLKLCDKLSNEIAESENEKVLLHWFLLLKSGYKARIGYNEGMAALLIPTKQRIYERPYYTFDDTDYYIIDSEMRNIHTYHSDYPGASKDFDLNLYITPNLPLDMQLREFEKRRKKDNFKIAYNKNMSDLYNDYPQADIDLFLQASVSPVSRESLTKHFEPLLENKTDYQKAEILLDFVQNNFDYKTDQEQFGNEKFFFPEEVFSYPYADCEDRSALFAYLIREFTDLDVIGLDYPGHIATAVNFNQDVKGSFINYKGKKYAICDPTYIGAPIGACMPEYQNKKAAIIELSKKENQTQRAENLWVEIYQRGGYRNNINQAAAVNDKGSMFICGSFTKRIDFDDKSIISKQKESGFIAKFNRQNDIEDIVPIENSNVVKPKHIYIQNNKVYLSGSLKEEKGESNFLAKLNEDLDLLWLKKLEYEIEKEDRSVELLLDKNGDIVKTNTINHLSVDEEKPLKVDEDFISLNKYRVSPVYKKADARMPGDAYAVAKEWRNESMVLREKAYHSSVAGFLAFVNNNMLYQRIISGKQIVASLTAFESGFNAQNAVLSSNLKKINTITFEDDEMIFDIINDGNIAIGPIIIKDGAKASIRKYYSGNLRLDFTFGAKYKSRFRDFQLHSLKLFKANGDIVIEYGDKHEQAILSVNKDIL